MELQKNSQESAVNSNLSDFVVILFYKFVDIADPQAVAAIQRQKCRELGLKGRMIIGEEGINATLEGTAENIEKYKKFLKSGESPDAIFADVSIKESRGTGRAFPKLSVKVRREIVALGAGRFDVPKETAAKLSADELQRWYETGEDFVVLDLRNDYEIASGKFEKTFNPGLGNFRDLPAKIGELKKEFQKNPELASKKIVPVCTGGIRCEKATCLLRREGFTNLYQLEDGIHSYVKKYPGRHFLGTLFVFDNRMTTDVVPTELAGASAEFAGTSTHRVGAPARTVIGRCAFCSTATENYCSDDSVRPSRKILCCETCFKKEAGRLREAVTN